MSIRLVNAIFASHDEVTCSGSDLAVFIRLAAFASDDGQNVYPSMSRIAKDVRLSVAQARRSVHKLERDGWLIKTGERRVPGRSFSTNEYRIAVERLTFTPSAHATPSIDVRGSAHAPLPLAPMQDDPLSDPLVDLYTGEPGETDQRAPGKKKTNDYSEDFETTWKTYPKRSPDKGDKRKAYRAWNARLTEKHTAADMLAAVKRYAAYCDAEGTAGGRYVMHVATFFGPADPPHFTKSWKPEKPKETAPDDFSETDYGKFERPGWAETA